MGLSQAAMVVADLLCAWAIAKILARLKVGAVGFALAIITLAYAFQATYVNFAHAIDAVLLSHALAEQARGSRRNRTRGTRFAQWRCSRNQAWVTSTACS